MAYSLPSVVSPGGTITAATQNANRTSLVELQAAVPQGSVTWSSPIAGGITVGNGTSVAIYTTIGGHTSAAFKFTMGSTSAITGSVTLTLPVAAIQVRMSAAFGYFDDAGGSLYQASALLTSGSTVATVALTNTGGTFATVAAISATTPFTWASGDAMFLQFEYFSG